MHPKPVPLRARVTPLQVKDMILGVFPGLHSEIEELMTSMYGDANASSPGSSPTASSHSGNASPGGKLSGGGSGSTGGGGGGGDDDDDAAFQKMFGFVKQSVDQLSIDASRASMPRTPGGTEIGSSKRMKSIHSVVKNLKGKKLQAEEEKADIPPSEREMFAYFTTNGSGKNIPIHLRTGIKLVKNRFFSKRECENMVHQVWRSKVRHTATQACTRRR